MSSAITVAVDDPTSVWDVLTAIGTLLAVGVAVWVAVREGKRTKEAQRIAERSMALTEEAHQREQEQFRRQREEQVSLVQVSPVRPDVDAMMPDAQGVRRVMLSVFNPTSKPIRLVRPWVREGQHRHQGLHAVSLLPPGATSDTQVELWPIEHDLPKNTFTSYLAEIVFVDAAGVEWLKDSSGHYHEVARGQQAGTADVNPS